MPAAAGDKADRLRELLYGAERIRVALERLIVSDEQCRNRDCG
jgi:hypothetical protein